MTLSRRDPSEIGFDAGKDSGGLAGTEFRAEPGGGWLVAFALVAAVNAVAEWNHVSGNRTGAIRIGHGDPMIHCEGVEKSGRTPANGTTAIEVYKSAIPLCISQSVRQIELARMVFVAFYPIRKWILCSPFLCSITSLFTQSLKIPLFPLLFCRPRLLRINPAASTFLCSDLFWIFLSVSPIFGSPFFWISQMANAIFGIYLLFIRLAIFAHTLLAMRGKAILTFFDMKMVCISRLFLEALSTNFMSFAGEQNRSPVDAVLTPRYKAAFLGLLDMEIVSCCGKPFFALRAASKGNIGRYGIMGAHHNLLSYGVSPGTFAASPGRFLLVSTPLIIPRIGAVGQ